MRLIALISFLIIWCSQCYAGDNQIVNQLRAEGASLYSRLMKIKDEDDFITNGFGRSKSLPRYERWREELNGLTKKLNNELEKVPSIQEKIDSEFFSLQNACNDLDSLARRYATRGGNENEYMKKLKNDLSKKLFKRE